MRYTERQVNSELLDQPEFTGEPKKIFICSTPRSGSYMLCRYMINAGLGVPHEYFNPINMRQIAPRFGLSVAGLRWRRRTPWDQVPFSRAARARKAEVDFLATYVDVLIRRRCQGGIFAAKIHFDQYLKVLDNPIGDKLLDGGLFIQLYREDLLAQAISTQFANLTGKWDIDDTRATAPAAQPDFFDISGIDQTLEGLAEHDRCWRTFLARNGLTPMTISYERLCEDPAGLVARIARRVGFGPGALRRGYNEVGERAAGDPGLPSKHEVARRYLAAIRRIRGLESAQRTVSASPAAGGIAGGREMTQAAAPPLFSVIIPTRNRVSLFATAIGSVLEQRFRGFEVIVVNDGSSADEEPRYRELVGAAPGVARLFTLIRTARGHGPGYVLNYGAAHARGEYLCFLDDDDQWTDPDHLARAAAVIAAGAEKPELLLANQRAFRDGTPVPTVIWIEDLNDRLRGPPDAAGAYTVTPTDLLRCRAHCHLNTTIISGALFEKVDGIDEGQRYEPERDFYFRAIDRARSIKYLPFVVSRHNIPDPVARTSVSTMQSELSKRLYQLRTEDRVILFSIRPELRRYAMRHRAYTLKHIATEAAKAGHFDCAAYYAREALMTKFTLGWLGMTALFALRSQLPLRRSEAKGLVLR